MKKSMLLSTIAMIVVVVVALSTATYAWFSSATNATATTTITTESTADWSMIQGTITALDKDATSTAVSFTSGSSQQITLNNTMMSGLFSPTAAVATTVAANAATTTLSGIPVFYDAQVNATGTETKVDKVFTNTTDSVTSKLPDAIRVINTRSGADGARHLILNIVVNCGQDTTNLASYYAGTAFTFYVKAVGAPNEGPFTNGYNYGTVADIAKDKVITANETPVEATAAITQKRPSYTAGDITANIPVQTQADTALNITANDHVLKYTLDLGTIAANQACTVLIYSWVDGWLANAAAGGANFSVVYAFTTGV